MALTFRNDNTANAFFDDCAKHPDKVYNSFKNHSNQQVLLNYAQIENTAKILIRDLKPVVLIQKFIELVKNQPEIAHILWKNQSLQECIANNISFNQFYEIYLSSSKIAGNMNRYPNFQFSFVFNNYHARPNWVKEAAKLFYDPADLIALMKFNPTMGNVIIQNCSDLKEVIEIQDLPTKLPELFGNRKREKINSLGLCTSDQYDIPMLEALGKVFLEINPNFHGASQALRRKMAIPAIYVCFGKMCIDHLNNQAISLPDELLTLFALAKEEPYLNDISKSQNKSCLFKPSNLDDINKFVETSKESGKKFFLSLYPELYNTPETLRFLATLFYKTCILLDPNNQGHDYELIKLTKNRNSSSELLAEKLADTIMRFNQIRQSIPRPAMGSR